MPEMMIIHQNNLLKSQTQQYVLPLNDTNIKSCCWCLVVGPHAHIGILIFEAKQKRVHWSELSPNGKLYLVLSPNWAVSRLYLKPPSAATI